MHDAHIFDYIELFVMPGTAADLAKWRFLDIPFILHAPHSYAGFNPSLASMYKENEKILDEVYSYAEALHPSGVIFHPGVEGDPLETIRQFAVFRKKFPGLFTSAFFENKPAVGQKGEKCLGASPSEIAYLIGETGFSFCLDFAHASCYAVWAGKNFQKIIKEFMALQPKIFHLSDTLHGERDVHLHLGAGCLDIPVLIRMIPSVAKVTLETPKDIQKDLQDFCDDAKYFNRQWLQERPVTVEDAKRLFDWRNDPSVIENSLSGAAVEWESHCRWLSLKLADPATLFRIFIDRTGTLIGQARVDLESGTGKVSISIDRSSRGRGLGSAILQRILMTCRTRADIEQLEAYVKQENAPSLAIFEASGFVCIGFIDKNGNRFVRFVLKMRHSL